VVVVARVGMREGGRRKKVMVVESGGGRASQNGRDADKNDGFEDDKMRSSPMRVECLQRRRLY